MKKQLRIFLAALLCITLLGSLLSVATAATPTAPGGGELNWVTYENSTTYLGANGKTCNYVTVTSDTENVYTEDGADDDGSSLKFTGGYAQWITAKIGFETDTYYQLSFYYKSSAVSSYKAVFSNVGVVTDGGSKSDVTDYLGYIDSDEAYYINQYGNPISLGDSVTAGDHVSTIAWNKMTVSFYSGNLTEGLFVFRPVGDATAPVYIDALNLTKVDTLADSDKFLNSWVGYNMSTEYFGGDSASINSNVEIAKSDEQDHDQDGSSLKISGGYAQWVAGSISVKKNCYYELSFYYYAPDFNSANTAAFSHFLVSSVGGAKYDGCIAIMEDKATTYSVKNGRTVTRDFGTATNAAITQWTKLTLTFYSGDLSNVLMVLRPTNASQDPIYIDNISLVEASTIPGEVGTVYDWTMYDNTTTKIGTGGTERTSSYTIGDEAYSSADADGDGTVLKVTGGYAQWVSAKVAVEKNSCYKLTGYYAATAFNADGGVFSDMIIIPDGGDKTDGRISTIDATAGHAYYLDETGEKVAVRDVSTSSVNQSGWNAFELYFYSGDAEWVWASFRPNGTDTVVYFDAIAVSEIEALPEPDPWAVYNTYNNTIIGTGAPTKSHVTETTEKYYDGADGDGDNTSYQISKDSYAMYAGYNLKFKANTYYELTAYYLPETSTGAVFSHIKIAKDGITMGDETGTDNLSTLPRDSDAFYYDANGEKVTLTGLRHTGAVANQWNKMTITFYSGSLTKAMLVLRPVLANDSIYIDAIQLTEIVPASDTVMSDARNSMRTEGNQALRYKFDIDKAALEASYGSYSITEYGYIAVRDKYLDQGALTFTAGALNNAYAVSGVAYNKADGTDVIFSTTDTTKTVSVALTNIGVDTSTGVIDYDAYGSGYTVRPYYILTGEKGDTIYAYGDTYSASVFATVQYIVNEENTDVDPTDRDAINNNVLDVVASDADTTTDMTVRDYYDAWIAANN